MTPAYQRYVDIRREMVAIQREIKARVDREIPDADVWARLEAYSVGLQEDPSYRMLQDLHAAVVREIMGLPPAPTPCAPPWWKRLLGLR